MTDTVENTPQQPETEETAIQTRVEDDRYRWYAVFTQSGMEKTAKKVLDERIRKFGLQDYFKQVLLPVSEKDYIDENGKKKKREIKMMPGYLLIHMEMNDKTFLCVRETPKITNFVGAAHNKMPPPMRPEEVDRLLNSAARAATEAALRPKLSFEKGERVKVIDGPFSNFIGDVDEVKTDKQKLRLLISVFGRPTPVEIEFSKVEKVPEDKPVIKNAKSK